jgi:hypothetical protein
MEGLRPFVLRPGPLLAQRVPAALTFTARKLGGALGGNRFYIEGICVMHLTLGKKF